MFESWAIVGPYPSWWLFNFLLLILQVLHIIWSYLIARIAVKALLRGKVRPCAHVLGGGVVVVGGYLQLYLLRKENVTREAVRSGFPHCVNI